MDQSQMDGNKHAAEFRRCLLELDVKGIRALWRHVSPGLAQPRSDEEALHALHLAREQAVSVPLNMRVYSRQWLNERRKLAVGVFFAAKTFNPDRQNEVAELREAMQSCIMDAYRAGVDLETEVEEVKLRMKKARAKL